MKTAVVWIFLLAALALRSVAVAEEKSAEAPAATEQTADSGGVGKDPFEIPNGSAQEILDFVDGLKKLPPAERTRSAHVEHVKRVLRTSLIAADRVVAMKPDADTEARAQHIRIEALWAVPRVAGVRAFGNVVDECRKLTEHKRPDVAQDAKVAELGGRLIWARADETQEPAELVDELAERISAGPLDSFCAAVTLTVASRFLRDRDEEFRMHVCKTLADALEKHPDPHFAESIARLRGTLEKLALVGHPIELSGIPASGARFDWTAYKGKVVLVDFWATWCGPCMAELPNVKQAYEKFHAQGFDIVGVSLDQDRSRLDAFLETEKLPWTTLVGPTPEQSGWKHPLAVRYGVDGIPAMFLVNRKGNVVSLEARGPELQKLVEQLLDEKAD